MKNGVFVRSKKKSAEEVLKIMRSKKDSDGNSYFSDYDMKLTEKQVVS